MNGPDHDEFPSAFGLVLDPATRRLDGGRVLVGGAPLRLLRLTPAGARVVDELATGEPVGPRPGRRRLARRLLDAGLAQPRPSPSRWTPADVTVVVPARAGASEVDTTTAALGPVGAVIVVDDGSSPPLPATAGALLIRHDRPLGPAAARNAGWRQAATALIAFVDADCEPEPGWLEALLPQFADPTVAGVAPRIVSRAALGAPAWLVDYESQRSPLDRGRHEARVRPGGPVPYVPSATLLVRTDALSAVGGFDERLRFGEDVDLVWRLVEAGWTLRYEPAVTVRHPTRSATTGWLCQRYQYGTSAAPLAARHGDAVTPLRVSVWSAAAWVLVGLGRPVAGTAVAAGTTALLAPRLVGLEHPWREAARLAGRGHLAAGPSLAEAVRRSWWPLALLLAVAWPRARPGVAAAFLLPPLADRAARRPRPGSDDPAPGPQTDDPTRRPRPGSDDPTRRPGSDDPAPGPQTDDPARRPGTAPLKWVAARLADDLAYGTGVWVGCLRARSAAALRPDLRNWPGRRPAIEDQTPTTETNDTISPG